MSAGVADLPPGERVCPWCPPDELCAFCHWMGPATAWAIEVGMRGVPAMEDTQPEQRP